MKNNMNMEQDKSSARELSRVDEDDGPSQNLKSNDCDNCDYFQNKKTSVREHSHVINLADTSNIGEGVTELSERSYSGKDESDLENPQGCLQQHEVIDLGLEINIGRGATPKFRNTAQHTDVIDLGLEVNIGREADVKVRNVSKVKTNPYRLCSAYAGYRIFRLSLEFSSLPIH